MKKKLLLLAILSASFLYAQSQTKVAPDCSLGSITFSGTGSSASFDNRPNSQNNGIPCTLWSLEWSAQAAVTSLTINIQGAPDSNGTAGTFATLATATTFPAGKVLWQSSSSYSPWMKVNVSAVGAAGTINATLNGWRDNAGSISAVSSSGCPNPCPVIENQPANSTATWTSATALNTTLQITMAGFSGIGLTYIQSGVLTQGTIAFEASADNSSWIPIGVAPIGGTSSLPTAYPLTNGSNAFQMYTGGISFFRIRLSVVILGAGSATFFLAPSVISPEFAAVVGQSTASNLQAQVQGVLAAGQSPNFPPVPTAVLDGAGKILTPADCTLNKNFDTSSAGDTLLVAGSGGQSLRVCKLSFQDVAGGNTEHLDQGTGATCGTGTASLWMTYVAVAATAEDFVWPLVLTTSNSVCINLANATRVTGAITYALY